MVTSFEDLPVSVETICQMCMSQIRQTDYAVVLTRLPARQSHMCCGDCWALMIAAAYAWIKDSGADGSDQLNQRLEDAWAIYLADHAFLDRHPGRAES